MALNVILPLRLATLLFALVELGLTAYGTHPPPIHCTPPYILATTNKDIAVIHYADDYYYEDPYGDWGVNHSSLPQVNFLFFSSIWSLLALIYLIAAPRLFTTSATSGRYHKYAILALDAVTAIFWLAGWIALAKLIGGPSTCSTFCAAIEASVAFAAFLWAMFSGFALMEMWEAWRVKKVGDGKGPVQAAVY